MTQLQVEYNFIRKNKPFECDDDKIGRIQILKILIFALLQMISVQMCGLIGLALNIFAK